ncbi:class III lanthionine synthetase LanKC N-terminal domain-containing protein [Chitinophaga vietnamensis]|uniref:class III lanthionine synthetase LanKC N-terminal domain-containing protein n=1 Tax=Chitinophaga vietnamensis TaxID=2593957 RepID=UPI0011778164|nr:lanthionine synthetase LanC family protein [Chitinophaga vietnamensis]
MTEAATIITKRPRYDSWLEANGIPFVPIGHYLQVGVSNILQGWLLHLSVIPTQIITLLERICPLLIKENIAFKIPATEEIAIAILGGHLGHQLLGKIITVYPSSDEEAARVAMLLIDLTRNFSGPAIPTDYHLGGIIYTRYGGINPMQFKDNNGALESFIYDATGNLVKDEKPIPFTLANDLQWPFSNIKKYTEIKEKTCYNGKYQITSLLKNDAKGIVAIVTNPLKFRKNSYFILKEGKHHVSSDDHGRDVRDRLRWQYELHKQLENDFFVPQAIDLFEEDDNLYFVMQMMDGIPLSDLIDATYQGKMWFNLSMDARKHLLGLLLELFHIIKRLHQRGFVHRDLSPRNFLVTESGKINCIDLELMYNLRSEKPLPPFTLGTPGYMSPEQMRVDIPDTMQDVYGLGGIMIRAFTCLSPKLFNPAYPEVLRRNLRFLIQDEVLADIICACLDHNPNNRPNVSKLIDFLENYGSQINDTPKPLMFLSSKTDIQDCLNKGYKALTGAKLTSENGLWISKSINSDQVLTNELIETTNYLGLHTGIGGVVDVLVDAARLGQPIDQCGEAINKNFGHLVNVLLSPDYPTTQGLYFGTAGNSLLLKRGIEIGWLEPADEILDLIKNGLLTLPDKLGISEGLAGQGLVVLQCRKILDRFYEPLLNQIVEELIKRQEKDGSWVISTGENLLKLYSFSHGIAGIIYFMLKAYQAVGKLEILHSAMKGLEFLESHAIEINGNKSWGYFDGNTDIDPWLEYGVTGIIIPFIEAYSITQNIQYKKLVISALQNHPAQINSPYLGIERGVAGLGEVYIHAANALKYPSFKDRAEWIAQFLLHISVPESNDTAIWITDNTNLPSADLMTGHSGILHFLLRYINWELLSYPLFK